MKVRALESVAFARRWTSLAVSASRPPGPVLLGQLNLALEGRDAFLFGCSQVGEHAVIGKTIGACRRDPEDVLDAYGNDTRKVHAWLKRHHVALFEDRRGRRVDQRIIELRMPQTVPEVVRAFETGTSKDFSCRIVNGRRRSPRSPVSRISSNRYKKPHERREAVRVLS
jgi:hypothetical protein